MEIKLINTSYQTMESPQSAEPLGSPAGTAVAAVIEQTCPLSEHHQYCAVSTVADAFTRRRTSLRQSRNGKRLNSNQRNALEIRILEREVAKKLAQAKQLELEHNRLQIEHQLLVECCDGLQLLRVQHGKAEIVDEAEQALLNQLRNIAYSLPANGHSSKVASPETADASGCQQASPCGACCQGREPTPAGSAAQDLLQSRLSPPDDRMYYLRYLLSLPPLQDAEHFTLETLVADYANTVHSLALQLHLAQGTFEVQPSAPTPAQKIKELIDRHLRIICTLLSQQREDLVQRFVLTNFETLQPVEELSLEACSWLLQAAGITAEQQADVALGMELFTRLLAPVLKEQLQLQQQIAKAAQEPHGSAEYKLQVELQERQLERLALLCRKEYQIRFAAGCWIVGHFTYMQTCLMLVKHAPYAPSILLLGKIMQEQHRQQQQQQKQEQVQ